MTAAPEHHTGHCHCGTVEFEVDFEAGLATALRCTCSLCRMRGAVVVFADLGSLRVTKGADALVEYRFNTGTARHWFCGTCGVYTHHQRRFDPSQFAVNAACLDGVSPFDFAEVRVVDGVNHPHDDDGVLKTIGHIRYEPCEPRPA